MEVSVAARNSTRKTAFDFVSALVLGQVRRLAEALAANWAF